jgi:amino acid transporter
MRKLTMWQLILLSTGGMIGAGWLFSPFYGYQTAGIGVLLSWVITAFMTLTIGLSFAEVATIIPIVGGVSRFIGVTHNKTISLVFLLLGWLSYIVYLPLEVQSAMQYLGFWFHNLVTINGESTTLSTYGLIISLFIIILLTWFNTLFITNVAKINTLISIWKILIPISIALILISLYGTWENIQLTRIKYVFSLKSILLAISGSGLAFAFTGFQNGLILANMANNPKKSLPYSLFAPIIVGFILYALLSLTFITCLGNKSLLAGTTAPLLGLLAIFNIHILFTILFTDAIIAPFGTANVYTAVTGRILLGLAQEFMPKSILTKLNKFSAPATCLWINAIIGSCFLLPFPTWTQLVSFLSSVVIFAYLAGPTTLLILRKDFPNIKRDFKLKYYNIIGYLGFICCSLLIYWCGMYNLLYLTISIALIIIIDNLFITKPNNIIKNFISNSFIILYLLCFIMIKYFESIHIILFPIDNLCIILLSILFCKIFIKNKVDKKTIELNLINHNIKIK